MKAHHLTSNPELIFELNPLFQESANIARELNTLLEGKPLTQMQVDQLFTHAEEVMTSTGKNRTIAGRAGEMAAQLGSKIQSAARALQDTTVMRGVDTMFNNAKQQVVQKLGQSDEGAALLKKLDYYAKLHAKYPTTSKFFYNTLSILTGALSGGLTGPAALAATKTIDGVLKGEQLTTAAGGGIAAGAKAASVVGAKHAVGAAVAGAKKVGNAISTGIDNINQAAQNLVPSAGAETVPGGNPPAPGGAEANPPAPGGAEAPVTGGGSETVIHKTVDGDQLGKLAQANQTTTQAIIDANPDLAAQLKAALNGRDLPQGLEIKIPTETVPAGTNPFAGNKFFKMGAGKAAAGKAAAAAPAPAAPAAPAPAAPAPAAPAPAAPAPAAPSSNMIDPFTGKKAISAESIQTITGKGLLEGFTIIAAPMALMIDVHKRELNEALGRDNKSVNLTKLGVNTVFFNVEKLHEHTLAQEARRNDWGREANAEIGRAAGRQGMTGQEFVQQKPRAAAAMGIGGNARTYSGNTFRDGEPNRFPGSPKPQKGNPNWRSTTHQGDVGNAFMDKLEKGLNTAGKAVGNWWTQSTTKVTAQRLQKLLQDANIINPKDNTYDSDAVAQVLVRGGVPAEYITSLYGQMGLPEPQDLTPPASTTQSDDDIIAAANAALEGGKPLSMAQKVRLDAIRKKQGLGPVNAPVEEPGSTSTTSASTSDSAPADTTAPAGTSAEPEGTPVGDGQHAPATDQVFRLLRSMRTADATDDLIDIANFALNRLYVVNRGAYTDFLSRLRTHATSKPPVVNVGTPADKTSGEAPAGTGKPMPDLGPRRIAAEGRRRRKAVVESVDARMLKEFEQFVKNIG